MQFIRRFNQMINESNREKIYLNGYEMWLDKEASVIYDTETAKNGIHYDVLGSGDNIYISSSVLNSDEKAELLKYIK